MIPLSVSENYYSTSLSVLAKHVICINQCLSPPHVSNQALYVVVKKACIVSTLSASGTKEQMVGVRQKTERPLLRTLCFLDPGRRSRARPVGDTVRRKPSELGVMRTEVKHDENSELQYLLSPLGSQSSFLVAAEAASSNTAAHRSSASLHPALRALSSVKLRSRFAMVVFLHC